MGSIRDHSRVANGDHSDQNINIRPGTPAFGQRARRRGGRSAEEIYQARQRVAGAGANLQRRKRDINAVLEGD